MKKPFLTFLFHFVNELYTTNLHKILNSKNYRTSILELLLNYIRTIFELFLNFENT